MKSEQLCIEALLTVLLVRSLQPPSERHPIRETIITLILIHSLSPILRTLTEATTSDSIWPLSGVLFALGLLLVDYSGSSDGRCKAFSVDR